MEKSLLQSHTAIRSDAVMVPVSKIRSPFLCSRQPRLNSNAFLHSKNSPVNAGLNLSTNLPTPAKKEAFRRVIKPQIEESFKKYPQITLKSVENSPFRPKNRMDSVILPLSGKNFDLIKIFTSQTNGAESENFDLVRHVFKKKSEWSGINTISTRGRALISLLDYKGGKYVRNVVDEGDKPYVHYDRATFNLKKFNIFPTTLNRGISRNSYYDLDSRNKIKIKPLSDAKVKRELDNRKKRIEKGKVQLKSFKKKEKKSKKKLVCNCKNSMCVKLYCECFRNNGFCNKSCGCIDCKNHSRNPDHPLYSKEIKENTEQDPEGSNKKPSQLLSRGCNCKRSKCLKKYCECFSYGVKCGDNCFCTSCQNT